MLKFQNTLSGELEEFHPLQEGKVGIYFCGVTVYDFAQIGNFRSMIFADILRRHLKFKGYTVTHVMNITDVEDRIIKRSIEAGKTIDDYTLPYIEAFWEDFDALGCERPEIVPRATRHIPEMINLIEILEKKGHAYRTEGSTYYRIASFPEYGKLSKINFTGNIAGGSDRVNTDKYDKEDARDFALWKAPESASEPAWDAAFGRGRPGWHIECSAMSMKYLGETFDIHAGGVDLVFPHHENEIAQSEGATGKQFVKYWLHAEHLKVEGESMSKSKGNYFTYRDLISRGFSPVGIRYFLLSVPYRKQLNFTFDALKGAEKTVNSLRATRDRLNGARVERGLNNELHEAAALTIKEFESGLDDDLNTSVALAAVNSLRREVNTALDNGTVLEENKREFLELIGRVDAVLNIFGVEQQGAIDDRVQRLIDERQEARRRRDFVRADLIREELLEIGITLEDTKDGVRWKRR